MTPIKAAIAWVMYFGSVVFVCRRLHRKAAGISWIWENASMSKSKTVQERGTAGLPK
jgi:hypothetical protein